MKKLIAVILTMVLTMSVAYAQTGDRELDVVRSLGIIRGNENGDLMLSKDVTRAEFAKMATMASSFRDNVSGNAYVSLFSDVRSEHWASGYIKLAVDNGWFTGYIDGSFRPNNPIKYEEGITVVLRIMGYDFSKAVGVFPNVQLDKAREIGLLKNLSGFRGSDLTRKQCKTLFYNMMVAKGPEGKVYGENIGLPISNDEVDYLSMLYKDLEGPFIYMHGDGAAPGGADIYKAGRPVSRLNINDVYYHNKGLNRCFVFDDKKVGRIDHILPNTINPESISIDGVKYTLEGYDAKVQFSSLGKYKMGDTVAVLLGIPDAEGGKNVVGVIDSASVNMTYYGMLSKKEKNNKREVNGKTEYFTKITVLCTDGDIRDFYIDSTGIEPGSFVKVKINEDGTDVSSMPKRSLSGKVTAKGIGDMRFAPGVSIQEYYEQSENKIKNISISDILDARLSSSDVLFYDTDDNNDIKNIILDDVTGNAREYGLLYSVHGDSSGEGGSAMTVHSSTYYYMQDGMEKELHPYGFSADVKRGGVEIYYSMKSGESDSRDKLLRDLEEIKVYAFSGGKAETPEGDMTISSDMKEIYVKEDGAYRQVSLDTIKAGKYDIKGYYNKTAVGKRIRVILAEKKAD